MRLRKPILLTAVSLTVVLAACASAAEGADPVDGVRTIEVSALDELRFDPETIEVAAGETIRFVVTNPGSTLHDFYIGTEEEQSAHAAEMGGMDHDADPEAEALTLEAGETDELTVTFDEPGTVLFGCHQPGHYDGGMVGTITVS